MREGPLADLFRSTEAPDDPPELEHPKARRPEPEAEVRDEAPERAPRDEPEPPAPEPPAPRGERLPA
jgi:hypothetical protein